MAESQTPAISDRFFLKKSKRGKFTLHRLAPHDQMQHNRHGDKRRSGKQHRSEKRQTHDHYPTARQNRLRRLTRYSISALSNCMLVSRGT